MSSTVTRTCKTSYCWEQGRRKGPFEGPHYVFQDVKHSLYVVTQASLPSTKRTSFARLISSEEAPFLFQPSICSEKKNRLHRTERWAQTLILHRITEKIAKSDTENFILFPVTSDLCQWDIIVLCVFNDHLPNTTASLLATWAAQAEGHRFLLLRHQSAWHFNTWPILPAWQERGSISLPNNFLKFLPQSTSTAPIRLCSLDFQSISRSMWYEFIPDFSGYFLIATLVFILENLLAKKSNPKAT